MSNQFYKKYPKSGFWAEDFFSEVMDSVVKCIDNYSTDKGRFYVYWMKVATNALNRFVKDNYPQIKHRSSNIVSFDYVLDNGTTLHDCYGVTDPSIEIDLIHERMVSLIKDEENDLRECEREVLIYYLEGYKPREIAIILNTSSSAIYRRFNQAVKKMRNLMKKTK